MQIHIGQTIREELRRQGHTNEWLAERIQVHPRTVQKIYLAEIHSLNPVAPTLGTNVFEGVNDTIPVYIPCGSSMVYYGRWQYFYNFIETGCEGIDDVNNGGVNVYARGSEIVVEGCYGEEAKVFDMTGREVYRGRVEGAIHVSDLGVYMVKVGDRPARKVVVM